jgi:hypothetical protein
MSAWTILDQFAAMGQQPTTRVNDFSQLRPGEPMGWTSWEPGVAGAGGTAAQPNDGAITFSRRMPRMPGSEGNAAKGRWRYMGNDVSQYGLIPTDQVPYPGGDSAQGVWQWEEDRAPAPMAMAPTEEAPQKKVEAPSDGRTIYNDWDFFQNQARQAVEGISRMPFTYSDYPSVATNKNDAINQFYPGSWQKNGLQPQIGPNGQNISNQVGSGIYEALRDGKASTAGAKDWPSLLMSLSQKGLLTSEGAGLLLDLAKQKKLDTSFQSSSLMGMGG